MAPAAQTQLAGRNPAGQASGPGRHTGRPRKPASRSGAGASSGTGCSAANRIPARSAGMIWREKPSARSATVSGQAVGGLPGRPGQVPAVREQFDDPNLDQGRAGQLADRRGERPLQHAGCSEGRPHVRGRRGERGRDFRRRYVLQRRGRRLVAQQRGEQAGPANHMTEQGPHIEVGAGGGERQLVRADAFGQLAEGRDGLIQVGERISLSRPPRRSFTHLSHVCRPGCPCAIRW